MTLLALAVDPAIPFAGDPSPLTGRAVFVAFLVVALLAALAWMLRRTAGPGRARLSVAVETAVSLGDRRSLVVVSVEGRRLLLGLTPANISLVTELQPPPKFDKALQASLGEGGAS
jgi:flagellar protein FliO/FliZ